MLKCKDIVGAEINGSYRAVLVTLEDGRCAMIDLDTQLVLVGVYLYQYDRFGKYFNQPFSDKELIDDILQNSKRIRGSIEWNISKEEREAIETEKRKMGYNY